MSTIIEKLEQRQPATPSRWREKAEFRQAHKKLLRTLQRQQILLLDKTIATSIQNLDFKHRKQPTYDYHTFMDSDGPVMKAISSTMLSQQRDMLNAILLDYVTLAKESVDCSCE